MVDNKNMPILECDVVMKGGITSGVVYPKALLRLKDTFRFRNIGGASAGAIAAAVAAAAELGRDRGGYDRVEKLPEEMAAHLSDLFQPWPKLRALYGVFLGLTKSGLKGAVGPALLGYWLFTLLGLAVGVVVALLAIWVGGMSWFALVLGVGAAFVGVVVAIAVALYCDVMKTLPKYDFGLCPGKTQPGRQKFDAFSNWLAVLFEEAAGRGGAIETGRKPLTFGDLAKAEPPITLRMMTTNLALGLGHALPSLGDGNYFWNEDELRRLLPDWVVDYMVTLSDPDERSGLRKFPAPDDLPVVLAVRMSLSFPILISAVPLHRIDFAAELPAGEEARPSRILFSDGGISSNFPVQFFDALLPGRPTFGISLDALDDSRNRRRVHLPMDAAEVNWFPIGTFDSLPAFGMAILNTAREWQDRRQAALSGYRERIVHVYLDDDEGGLNLRMEKATIEDLVAFGDRAGALMTGHPVGDDRAPFDFTDHRWRRFLIAYYQIEQLLEEMQASWGDPEDSKSFAAAVARLVPAPPSYTGSTKAWRKDVWDRIDALMTFSRATFQPPLRNKAGAIPKHKARLQIVPEV